jgi:hypothetical protein
MDGVQKYQRKKNTHARVPPAIFLMSPPPPHVEKMDGWMDGHADTRWSRQAGTSLSPLHLSEEQSYGSIHPPIHFPFVHPSVVCIHLLSV